MALTTFPELAVNLIYTALCLVPGFVTLKAAVHFSGTDADLDKFDKSTWSLIGSGVSLSLVYYAYVAWRTVTTGRVALVVPLDLQWTELVAAYPLLLGVAALVGYLVARLGARARGVPGGAVPAGGDRPAE